MIRSRYLIRFIIAHYCCVFQLAEHYINQNNSIDIYQPYFTDPSCQKMQTLAPSFRTVAVMSDPREPTRPVQNISWSPDQGTLVAVSYADMRFQMADPDTSSDSFIFDLGMCVDSYDSLKTTSDFNDNVAYTFFASLFQRTPPLLISRSSRRIRSSRLSSTIGTHNVWLAVWWAAKSHSGTSARVQPTWQSAT